MRRWIFCLSLMVVPNWAFGQTWECREVMVPMRDGVELATDVYVPENQFDGPYPVLIERTPYSKRGCEHLHARYFVKRGYVVLIQDERGRYNSEGTYYWLHPDGYSQTLRQNILRARYRVLPAAVRGRWGSKLRASSGGQFGRPPANGRSAERISADAAVDRPALLLRLWWRGGRRGMAIKGGAPHINNGF